MPWYGYKCECGVEIEISLKIAELDSHKEVCDECGKEMKRLLSAVPFKFEGDPPRDYQPLSSSKPKSQVKSVHDIKRKN
jgi:putative FmdB family regulatory protein